MQKMSTRKLLKNKKDLVVVVFTHIHDYFFAKICISSIRYYYPEIPIYLVKDYYNGYFSSFFLEKFYKVKVYSLGKNNIYGFTNAKVLLYLRKDFPYKKALILDADTIFVGKVLDNVQGFLNKSDFLVSPEYHIHPGTRLFESGIFNIKKIKGLFPKYRYPGFIFNSSPIFIKPGIIKAKDLLPYFNSKKFPFWQKNVQAVLTNLDVSLLNILLPTLARKKKISLNKKVYMKWSESLWTSHLTINDVISGKCPYIIHWASATKKPYVKEMTRGDILFIFEKLYYSKIPFGNLFFYLKFRYTQVKRYIQYVSYRLNS